MKIWAFWMSLACVGCGRDAIVISSDGETQLGGCATWPSLPICVASLCPDGAYVLRGAKESKTDTVMRCVHGDGGTR